MSNKKNNGLSVNLLPDFYQTLANKKFLQSTVDQLFQPGTVSKTSGYIGRTNAKAAKADDVYVKAANTDRQNYQLEPSIVIKDDLGNVTHFKDYQDYINRLGIFGGNTANHARLNKQEFYSWDPHIDWDKFVNFQNYYWMPYGPEVVKIAGQSTTITSTFTVEIQSEGDRNEYLFTPNGLDLNPNLKLYRGQTYKFVINSPGNPFSFKTIRSLNVADRYVIPGITNNTIETGTITFTVPDDAPSLLFYQSETDINLGGAIEIYDVTEASKIDVTNEILGKRSYKLANGTELSNGMKISFVGEVTPASYATGSYYVEGVGTAIKLVPEKVLQIVSPYTTNESIQFDSTPFDVEPFSDATGFASIVDYIVINRASKDHNPWSRYNRWFHKDVIEASSTYNGNTASLDQSARAVRPIIEFEADLKLFNLGTTATLDVDLVDTFTTDVFSTIEGSRGYNIDGVALKGGQRILFLADTDPIINNKIYEVSIVNINGSNQIHLAEVAVPVLNQVTLVLQGVANQSKMYWYNGTTWVSGQEKTNTNQQPQFDVVDSNGISFGDNSVYNGTTFKGTSVFSYKVGKGIVDTKLGFPLSYQNVNNIGDIVFSFDLAIDKFQYKASSQVLSKSIETGYLVSSDYAGNTQYVNGWKTSTVTNVQAAVRIYKGSAQTNNFNIDIFDDISKLSDLVVRVYVNSTKLLPTQYSIVDTPVYKKVVLKTAITKTDVLTIKAFSNQAINSNGYYEIPINLQNNPLNDVITTFTLGEVIDHVSSIIDNTPTFVGSFPGAGNLRDLGNITSHGTKFVQHSGPLSTAIYHIAHPFGNVVKSIETSRDDYSNFKRIFVSTISSLGVDGSPAKLVDLALQKINLNKPKTGPYYFSDMVPYGASITTNLKVVDRRIKTYPLSAVFTLDTLSHKSVLVYHNNVQLLHEIDYTFNSQGIVVINDSVPLVTGDVITTVEYDSTDGSFVPMTPTKLGMWPKFEPKIYVDTSLVTPRTMIQGHDGSQLLAYGDYRDDVILELEKRIYNNIKVSYDTSVFDIDQYVPNYARTADYSLSEFNEVLSPNFYKWVSLVGVDFSKPLSYDRTNSFTYNYSANTSPDGKPVPGYWRGVYRWMLDTDRPHLCPWEMLGFSIEPSWWTSVYGPAPYTSDNLVMWQDLATGTIRKPGTPPTVNKKYVRPVLTNHIPVDSQGNLLSPYQCGLTSGTISQNIDNNFVFGDVSPVEAAWRRSSHYPFSMISTALLLNPANVFGTLLDRSRTVRNKSGQLIYSETGLRVRPTDIVLPSVYSSSSRIQTAGLINWIVDLIFNISFSNNLVSYDAYKNDLDTMDVNLSYRVGAFTSKDRFNLLLESKTPLSTGNVFVPQEDYNIFLNISSPVKKLVYSGVIITKLSTGYEVKGYSQSQPYFNTYQYVQTGALVNVGGISENFVTWTAGQQYSVGTVVKVGSAFYRATANTTAGAKFDPAFFASLKELPVVGGVSAYFRKTWDKSSIKTVSYGTLFESVQDVVDFLLGYSEYLKDQGFNFDDFNTNLNAVANWETSAKEFMFWTTQNWSTGQDKWTEWIAGQPYSYGAIVRYNGDYYSANFNIPVSNIFEANKWTKLDGLNSTGSSVISLSPAANGITFTTDMTVVADIQDQQFKYEFFKVDGTPISYHNLDSYREGNTVTYTPERTNDGIYCAVFHLIQNEHVLILNNVDIFNDVIYNPPSGYRRERIKVSGYVSTDWYGGFDIPGFIYDQASIQQWQPWQDYNMGDTIAYQGNYYAANAFTAGTESFVSTDWTRLSKKPTPQILPNWTNLATQFADFYSLDVDSFDSAQQTIAQHLIGYQKREYLNNIIQDPVSEFKFFQGMIREKGSLNVLNKLFGVLNSEHKESLTFYEEWALRVGRFGASQAFEDLEIVLDDAMFRNNPQGIALTDRKDSTINPFIIQYTPNDVYVRPIGYDSAPFPKLEYYRPMLRSAGYVTPSDIAFSLGSISDITSKDVKSLGNGEYVWTAFKDASWDVYRFTDLMIRVTDVAYSGGVLTIQTSNIVPLKAGDYVGISLMVPDAEQISGLSGFFKVDSVLLNQFTVSTTIDNFPAPFTLLQQLVIYALVTRRTESIDTIGNLVLSHLNKGELIWTDDNGSNKSATWEYNPVYTADKVINATPASGYSFGSDIVTDKAGSILAISNATGTISVFDKVGRSIKWTGRSTLDMPFLAFNDPADPSKDVQPNQVAQVLTLSSDATWLITGSPEVGYIATAYQGVYSPTTVYNVDQIVQYAGKYYRAIVLAYGNTPGTDSIYWEEVPYIPVSRFTGVNSTLAKQGAISIYKKDINNIYTLVDTIVSPNPTANEQYGSSLAFGNNAVYVLSGGTNIVSKLVYETVVHKTVPYNPVGSSGTTVAVTSTAGIRAGMMVEGTGFTLEQEVESVLSKIYFAVDADLTHVVPDMEVTGINVISGFRVVSKGVDNANYNFVIVAGPQDLNPLVAAVTFNGIISLPVVVPAGSTAGVIRANQVLLTVAPDSTPNGNLNFVTKTWTYDTTESFASVSAMNISADGSVLVLNQNNAVNVYVKPTGWTGFAGVTPQVLSVTGSANFGQSVAISETNKYIAVSDDAFSTPAIPVQGAVYVFEYSNGQYNQIQQLVNPAPEAGGLFGNKLSFMNDSKTIVVYSKNGDTEISTTFDTGVTSFDKQSTAFVTKQANNGRVDVFDRYNTNWVFSETLQTSTQDGDGYGTGFAACNDCVIVSAINALDNALRSGIVYAYYKTHNAYTWTINRVENDIPDVTKVKKAFLYNKLTETLVTYIDVIDPLQGKIAGPAEEEIKFKTFYDPATYSTGNTNVIVDTNAFWSDEQVGMLWWDLRTAKFINNYVDDIGYRNNAWNTLAPGASIDVYEWVSTSLQPAQWDAKADTPAGIAQGISGTSLYGANVYSQTQKYDNISKTYKSTYYFWVKNKKVVPAVNGRHMSASDVSALIANPRAQGYTCLALTGTNTLSLINASKFLKGAEVVLAIEYWTSDKIDRNIHSQWKLISNDTIVTLPKHIEQKWFDSLCGKDEMGREVPDPTLPVKLRYGIENRPRQGMFVNRVEAIKEIIERVNATLLTKQISASTHNFELLNKFDAEPSVLSGLYDAVLDTNAELNYSSTAAFKRPSLTPIITDGVITGINIVSAGKGYVNAPEIHINGVGVGAVVKAKIDTLGRITGATIVNGGEGYTDSTTCSVRDYSVLIHSDATSGYDWSIYSFNPVDKVWSRASTQTFNVTKYWKTVDWYATGFNQFVAADFAVATFADINSINPEIGDVVKVLNAGQGEWMLLEKTANVSSVDWTQSYTVIGIQNGTIQFNTSLYKYEGSGVGYDSDIFDAVEFDVEASSELRYVLTALRDDILIGDLKQTYLDLFFVAVHYAHREQPYIDWIFKTSFVRATHYVGQLDQPVNYPVDNLRNFQDYIAEVKPYRTKIREYISNYAGIDTSETAVTDFDLQPAYENGSVIPVSVRQVGDTLQSFDSIIDTYPWKFWTDNNSYKVTEIKIVSGGSGYIRAPEVIITSGSGKGAVAKAYVTNGSLSRIIVTEKGSGYLTAPTIKLAGGLSLTGVAGRAVAIIGGSPVRSNKVALKFDRTTDRYFITDLTVTEVLSTASGSKLQWALKWAPDIRIGKTSVTVLLPGAKNPIPISRDLFKTSVVTSTSAGYTQYSGKITFDTAPVNGAIVTVTYHKDVVMLNAVDRIQFEYNPTTGQLGKDLSQLMTGVDYGGVVVSGLDFNINGGWGVTPWTSEKWSVEDPNFDDYIVQVAANTHTFTLPYVPAVGEVINVYHVKKSVFTHVSDGVKVDYTYDINLLSPSVSVTSTKQTRLVQTAYSNTFGFTLIVASTAGIIPGMVITGTGFTSRQTVVKVVDAHTLNISAVANTTPSGTLTFSNNAGSKVLALTDVTGLAVGDTVTSGTAAFSANTVITAIDVPTNCVTLNQILYVALSAGTTITFTQDLVQPTDVIISAKGTIKLTTPYAVGSTIVVSGNYASTRLPAYDFTGDGVHKVITISNSYTVNDGDEFIFRKESSDGSVTPAGADYDTALTGGDLAYSTATGLNADDIVVDGDGFNTPTASPAPEEVVPGQVVDTLAIKVFSRSQSGSAKVKTNSYVTDGTATSFDIGQHPNSPRAVIVKLGANIQTYGSSKDYTIDYVNDKIVFNSAPTANQVVSVFSFGFSGSNILDLDYFVGDGTTTEFIARADWVSSVTPLVYVNGIVTNVQLFKTDSSYEYTNAIGIRFATAPAAGALINYMIVTGSKQTFGITSTETITANGSLSYKLQYPIGNKLPNETNMIVRVDQSILKGPNNSYFTIGGNRLNYFIDPATAVPNSVTVSQVKVYADNNLLALGRDYSVDPSGISVKLTKAAYATYNQKQLVVSLINNEGYSYDPISSTITFSQAYTAGNYVEVITSYVSEAIDMERTEIINSASYQVTPDTVQFYTYKGIAGGTIRLDRQVIDNQYVLLVKNNTLLVPSIDFKLNDDYQSIQLVVPPAVNDAFTVITFGSNVLLGHGIAYMQFKDMLNRTTYKRLNASKSTRLTAPLHWNDTTISVADASAFDAPNPSKNKPGIIEIRGERIEFFSITGNVLSQLRRGTLGTGINGTLPTGTIVQEIGSSETIPYNDSSVVQQFISDGASTISLNFTPSSVDEFEVFVGGYDDASSWEAGVSYNVNDIVRIGSYTYRCSVAHTSSTNFFNDYIVDSSASKWTFFIGNRRLLKTSYSVFNINKAPYSPAGDETFAPDFTLNTATNQITLRNPVKFGTQVTIVQRTGSAWDSTNDIINETSDVATFIKAQPGIWYYEY